MKIEQISRYFSTRFNGENVFTRNLKNIQSAIPYIQNLPEDSEEHIFWKAIILEYLDSQIKREWRIQFLPQVWERKLFKPFNWNQKLNEAPEFINVGEGNVNINGMIFPIPADGMDGGFSFDAFSTLIQQFLDLDVENCDYNLYYATPEGPYEYCSVKIEKDDVVIDAGACNGEFAALATYKGAKVYAFEPAHEAANIELRKILSLYPSIEIIPYALYNEETELSFFIDLLNTEISHIDIDGGKGEKIKAISIDAFAHKENLQTVDFIKADIEGAERYMLEGAQAVLKDFAPKLALCTYHLPDDPQVMKDLILKANPNYVIDQKLYKLYAHVPK